MKIVFHEIVGILLRRRRAGPHVDDGLDRKGDPIADDHLEKGAFVDIVGIPPLDEVLPLPGSPQLVDDDDGVLPLSVQLRHKGASDESGAAGDNDHLSDLLI